MGGENTAYLTFNISEELTMAVLFNIWCSQELATAVD
jgi:hypothetical protein